jgi:hypothetical protein
MASPDDLRRQAADEAALAPFFAAARAAEPPPPVALLSAILADAGEVSAARAERAHPAPAPVAPRRWHAVLIDPVGGWRGVAALGACAVVGFWLGLVGTVSIDDTGLQTGTGAVVAEDEETGLVADFYDLASVEP